MTTFTQKVYAEFMDCLKHLFQPTNSQKICPKEHDYYKVDHTPGLFTNKTRPIWFTLAVVDVGMQSVLKQYAEYFMSI